jgi:predicted AAA+ superfamily ATPase
MIRRRLHSCILERLRQFPAVALLGSRQVGKTTLAERIAKDRPCVYLDLESPADRDKLSDPILYLSAHEEKLVILDEVHRVPELFQALRGLIDRGRGKGVRSGRFLLLGSASIELLRQSGESLAGRIAYVELDPFDGLEVESTRINRLWTRGGFPESFLAADEPQSVRWREQFIRTYLERDIPALGPRVPAETLRRFWTMLAHSQGGLLNAAQFARGLAVDGKTIARYLDLLVDLLLVRRLMPWHQNTGKRQVKSPRVYVRDSGIVHALLGIGDHEALLGHPVVGASWEGFVIQNLMAVAPERTIAGFYRTGAGAELDLLLEVPGGELWAIEIKRGLTPRLGKGFHQARADLSPSRCFVVYPGQERYPLEQQVEAIGLHDLMRALAHAPGPHPPKRQRRK